MAAHLLHKSPFGGPFGPVKSKFAGNIRAPRAMNQRVVLESQ
jgi:hypothetical protein